MAMANKREIIIDDEEMVLICCNKICNKSIVLHKIIQILCNKLAKLNKKK